MDIIPIKELSHKYIDHPLKSTPALLHKDVIQPLSGVFNEFIPMIVIIDSMESFIFPAEVGISIFSSIILEIFFLFANK
ncbi:MAG: hypothetical protein ACTSQP_22465 [Promethearchaeota archaeon]